MAMTIELRHLRSFQAVADHLNFHRAAADLYITQPALSRQIARLEAEIGCALFTRDKRRVQLTQAGQYLYRQAGQVLENVDTLIRETQEAADGKRGSLALGYTESAMAGFLPRLLRETRNRMPDVSLHLRQEHSEQLAREVARGRLDAAFISLPAQIDGLKSTLVAREQMGMVLPDNHRLAQKKELSLRELSAEKFILFPYEANPRLYSDILDACRQAGFAPRLAEEADTRILAVNMVSAGLGVTFLSEHLANYCGAGTVFRPLKKPRPGIRFYFAEPEQSGNESLAGLKRILQGMAGRTG